jgi:heptosyltransferase III
VKERAFENVLVVRTDRIGDVVLTLPMIPVLRSVLPRARISMLLRPYTAALVDGFEGIDDILTYDDSGERKGFFAFLAELRARHFDLVVVSHPTFRIAALAFLAGIQTRVGSGYRWYSFLFNKPVFEHRKTAEKHEAEYNLSLLRTLGVDPPEVPRISLPLDEHARRKAAAELERIGVSPTEDFVVLHPGSGGSARDWSPRNFGELAKGLAKENVKVVVTGIDAENALVNEVVTLSGGSAFPSVGRLTLKELGALVASARLFVSNSTGPLHIAAAVGTPVIAFYPPIRECSPRRWGPLTDKKIVFTADNLSCPRCQGGPCQGNDCMEQIKVTDVLRAAKSLLAREDQSNGT